MPPLSDTERQKLLLQQEIAKLSGAISRHATNQTSHPDSYHPYRGYSRGGSRGGYASRARGRGRGRGGGYSLDLRSTTGTTAPSSSSAAGPSRFSASGTATPAGEKEEGEVSPPPEASKPAASSSEGWVKKTSRGGNMSLMTVQKRDQLASRPAPPPKPKVRVPAHIQVLESTAEASPGGTEGKRVVIDGVIFQFEQGGSKLTRIGELASGQSSTSPATPTRHSLHYGGEQYRRTKRGNLISRSSLSQRRAEQATKHCRYFTKTGHCDRALTCPYKHDQDRIAICPRFLRGACTLGDGACPLSHTPSAHNTPSCVHFQATATCRNGDSCLYPHVRVADDAPVCEAFAREGWCDREAGTCPELHIWECPEWHAKGTCARGTRCGLRHVLRRKGKTSETAAPATTAQDTQEGEGQFEDQSEFIGLPGDVVSETSDSEEDEEDEDDEDEEDEEDEDDEGSEDGNEDDKKAESMEVDGEEDSGKLPPSSPGMRTDDDDELQVLGEL